MIRKRNGSEIERQCEKSVKANGSAQGSVKGLIGPPGVEQSEPDHRGGYDPCLGEEGGVAIRIRGD